MSHWNEGRAVGNRGQGGNVPPPQILAKIGAIAQCLMRVRKLSLLIVLVRGHSTTTWTNFDPILTPSPPRVDKRGHSTYPPPCPRGQKGQKKPPHIKYSTRFNLMYFYMKKKQDLVFLCTAGSSQS